MTGTKKTLTKGEYLQALALFTMAHKHQVECYKFAAQMRSVLGTSEDDQVTDAVHSSDANEDFDAALRNAGYSVADAA